MSPLPDTPPLTPDHLRALIAYADGLARAHFGYAHWLDSHGYTEQAAQVHHEADEAFARGFGAQLDLEVWEETVGAGAPRTEGAG